jgi:hypothetical protein
LPWGKMDSRFRPVLEDPQVGGLLFPTVMLLETCRICDIIRSLDFLGNMGTVLGIVRASGDKWQQPLRNALMRKP